MSSHVRSQQAVKQGDEQIGFIFETALIQEPQCNVYIFILLCVPHFRIGQFFLNLISTANLCELGLLFVTFDGRVKI